MATPQNVSKLDMSLDEIIKMNKKIQLKEKQKGPARAQGGGKGGQKGEGGGKSSGNDQPKLKPARKARQNVKRTPQNSSSGSQGTKNKRRSGNALKSRQRPTQSGTPQGTGVKSRLGMKKVTTKGKSAVKQIFTSHGLSRGGKNDGGIKGQRPGSRIKIIRDLKAARGNPSSRSRGNAPLKQLETVKDGAKQNAKRPRSRGADKRASNSGAQAGRGGKRGGKQNGRGKVAGEKGKVSTNDEGSPKPPEPEYSPKPMPSVPRLPPFDPPGVDLPLRICMDHHTSQPLHRRFTPQLKGQNTQRLVQKGGRTINYSK